MNVTGTRPATELSGSNLSGSMSGEAERHDAGPASESRALVAGTGHEPLASYRPAAFLAHLIATKEQLPQTCERRRAEPSEAIAAYRAVEAMTAK
jgi:hypothetical protein